MQTKINTLLKHAGNPGLSVCVARIKLEACTETNVFAHLLGVHMPALIFVQIVLPILFPFKHYPRRAMLNNFARNASGQIYM